MASFDLPARLRELPRLGLIGLVQTYRYALRPVLGNRCRYLPTCSEFALEALNRHGAARGSAMAAGRLLRCHPFCAGGYDPVPERAPRLFTFVVSNDGDNGRAAFHSVDTPQVLQSGPSRSPLSNKSRTKISP